eukprot:GHVT01101709.1.p3 GENE.GHVT01101709.1~~GHVT01101709.1.p3  ORF type:complete len:109 (-),score=8.45 GHVT01101709.1:51-377(-)
MDAKLGHTAGLDRKRRNTGRRAPEGGQQLEEAKNPAQPGGRACHGHTVACDALAHRTARALCRVAPACNAAEGLVEKLDTPRVKVDNPETDILLVKERQGITQTTSRT